MDCCGSAAWLFTRQLQGAPWAERPGLPRRAAILSTSSIRTAFAVCPHPGALACTANAGEVTGEVTGSRKRKLEEVGGALPESGKVSTPPIAGRGTDVEDTSDGAYGEQAAALAGMEVDGGEPQEVILDEEGAEQDAEDPASEGSEGAALAQGLDDDDEPRIQMMAPRPSGPAGAGGQQAGATARGGPQQREPEAAPVRTGPVSTLSRLTQAGVLSIGETLRYKTEGGGEVTSGAPAPPSPSPSAARACPSPLFPAPSPPALPTSRIDRGCPHLPPSPRGCPAEGHRVPPLRQDGLGVGVRHVRRPGAGDRPRPTPGARRPPAHLCPGRPLPRAVRSADAGGRRRRRSLARRAPPRPAPPPPWRAQRRPPARRRRSRRRCGPPRTSSTCLRSTSRSPWSVRKSLIDRHARALFCVPRFSTACADLPNRLSVSRLSGRSPRSLAASRSGGGRAARGWVPKTGRGAVPLGEPRVRSRPHPTGTHPPSNPAPPLHSSLTEHGSLRPTTPCAPPPPSYKTFDDFLMALQQRRRKSVRQERKKATEGLRVTRPRARAPHPPSPARGSAACPASLAAPAPCRQRESPVFSHRRSVRSSLTASAAAVGAGEGDQSGDVGRLLRFLHRYGREEVGAGAQPRAPAAPGQKAKGKSGEPVSEQVGGGVRQATPPPRTPTRRTQAYLTREFFHMIGEGLGDSVVLVLAEEAGGPGKCASEPRHIPAARPCAALCAERV